MTSLVNKLNAIDKYLSSPDYALLLYRMKYKAINEMADKGYNICIVIFESINNLLSWLKIGKTPNHGSPIEFKFVSQKAIVEAEIQEKHKNTIKLCNPVNTVGILVTYYTEDHEISEILSATCFRKTEDFSVFDDVGTRYPEHSREFLGFH